jgi:hypothetical protein
MYNSALSCVGIPLSYLKAEMGREGAVQMRVIVTAPETNLAS